LSAQRYNFFLISKNGIIFLKYLWALKKMYTFALSIREQNIKT
jgi:hypothetical protein